MSKNQVTFIENWIDDNSQRLSEISGQNQQLYDAIFNVLDYINNVYGGGAIEKPVIEKEEVIEEIAKKPVLIEDFSMTKLFLPNLEERRLAVYFFSDKGYYFNPISKPYEEEFWWIGDSKEISTSHNAYDFTTTSSQYKRIYLQEIGVLPPFVEVSLKLERSKIKTATFEESKELLEMLQQMKMYSYKPFAVVNSTTSFNTLARHNYFYFTWQQGFDNDLGWQPIDFFTDEREYDNSTFKEINFRDIKNIFEMAKQKKYLPEQNTPKISTPENTPSNTKVKVPKVGKLDDTKIWVEDETESIAIQQKAFKLGYFVVGNKKNEIEKISWNEFPCYFVFSSAKSMAIVLHQTTRTRFDALPFKEITLDTLGISQKSLKKLIPLQENTSTSSQNVESEEDDFDKLLDQLNNLNL